MEKLKEESQRWCSPDVSFHRKLKEHLGVGGLGATAKPWAGGRWRKPNPRGGSVTQEKALRQRVLPTPAPAGRNFRKPVGHVFCLPQSFPSCTYKNRKKKKKLHSLCRVSARFILHPDLALFFLTGFQGIEVGNQGPARPALHHQSPAVTSRDTGKHCYVFSSKDILNLLIVPKGPYVTLSSRSMLPLTT